MKVEGRSKPFYVIRRRVIDGGYECNCPRWVEQRKECRHITAIKPVLARAPRVPSPVDNAIATAVKTWRYYTPFEGALIDRIQKAVRAAIGGSD